MYKFFFIFIAIIWFFSPLSSLYSVSKSNKKIVVEPNEYVYNPLTAIHRWLEIEPYFLPVQHPIKKPLDKLFQKTRVTQSKETLEKAGFSKIKKQAPTKITTTTHPLFPHYIFKIYLDTQPSVDDSAQWIKRIKSAHAVRECIKKYGFKHLYVPQKWIYPLPLEPSPPQDDIYYRKNFILVVEKVALVSYQQNRQAFKTKMTKEILNELYSVLKELNLINLRDVRLFKYIL
jgi:hypothetical protein